MTEKSTVIPAHIPGALAVTFADGGVEKMEVMRGFIVGFRIFDDIDIPIQPIYWPDLHADRFYAELPDGRFYLGTQIFENTPAVRAFEAEQRKFQYG